MKQLHGVVAASLLSLVFPDEPLVAQPQQIHPAGEQPAARENLGGSAYLRLDNLGFDALTTTTSPTSPLVAFYLYEGDVHSDLNGDGDLSDLVLQVFDSSSG
ncbi:MAG: hypothetical protein HYR85_26415 [Planctomycetes bacterium]|nr:hypothetical protein [Planctomycetota bacterium]MBI3843610.1 hypothetical protein [Planctomycetota bacterium]